MGYTDFTVSLLEKIIKEYKPKTVLDLGAQNLYNQPLLPAPYASTWYESQDISYTCIDLNGENNALIIDLSNPPKDFGISKKFDLIVDAGTSEHVGRDGKFDWKSIYNCWSLKHNLLKVGGIMVNENPMHNNWPGHGFNYYTNFFYWQLSKKTNYEILDRGNVAAMGNETDGWNVWCVLKKNDDCFLTLEHFKGLDIRQQ